MLCYSIFSKVYLINNTDDLGSVSLVEVGRTGYLVAMSKIKKVWRFDSWNQRAKSWSAMLVGLIFMGGSLEAADEWIPLWDGPAPGSPNPSVVEESSGRRLTDTSVPGYELYLAKTESGDPTPAVVIFPGGGYSVLAYGHEGRDYAKWFNEREISAMVVKYRVSRKDDAGFHYPAPLLDARRAIRTLRARADEWRIDGGRIGVMGSSAGGHLAAMTATTWGDTFETEVGDVVDEQSARPDFAILVYPVISMTEKWGHGGSKRRLLGPEATDKLAAQVSAEQRVTAKTPPCFLVHAVDDGVVPVRNSLAFAQSLADHRVPFQIVALEKGGHGFGMRDKGNRVEWPSVLAEWLAQQMVGKK